MSPTAPPPRTHTARAHQAWKGNGASAYATSELVPISWPWPMHVVWCSVQLVQPSQEVEMIHAGANDIYGYAQTGGFQAGLLNLLCQRAKLR